jgi:hypothetical protein
VLFILKKEKIEPHMVAHVHNPVTWESEVRGLGLVATARPNGSEIQSQKSSQSLWNKLPV